MVRTRAMPIRIRVVAGWKFPFVFPIPIGPRSKSNHSQSAKGTRATIGKRSRGWEIRSQDYFRWGEMYFLECDSLLTSEREANKWRRAKARQRRLKKAEKNGEEHRFPFKEEILDMRIIYQDLRLILWSTTNDNTRFKMITNKVKRE